MAKPVSREFFEVLDRATRLTGEARIAYANAGYLRARVGLPRPSSTPAGRPHRTIPGASAAPPA